MNSKKNKIDFESLKRSKNEHKKNMHRLVFKDSLKLEKEKENENN